MLEINIYFKKRFFLIIFVCISCFDYANRLVHKINSNVTISTFAGQSKDSHMNSKDGAGVDATFFGNRDLTIGKDDTIYILEPNKIRKVTPDSRVITFVGSDLKGFSDGNSKEARFNSLGGIAVDNVGNLYVTDSGNQRICKITSSGIVSTIAGSGTAGAVDGVGIEASFDYPKAIAIGKSGIIYISDSDNKRIRKINPDGNVSTFLDENTTTSDGNKIGRIYQMTLDNSDNLYLVAEDRISKVNKEGNITAFYTRQSNREKLKKHTEITIYHPFGITADNTGNIYVSNENKIFRITPEENVWKLIVDSTLDKSSDKEATFCFFYAITIDRNQIIYASDPLNHKIHKIVWKK